MSFYLGIDVGTSGTKTLVMDSMARVLATATAEHEVLSPKPGWSEQDPEQWYQATVRSVRESVDRAGIDPAEVKAIGFSGQMHGLVITDQAGKPLRPSLIWNDQRTAAEAAEIEQAVGGPDKLIELVGNRAMTSFTLTKLLWVRKHEPRIYERIAHMLLPKDYVRFRMTGTFSGDVSDMSGTLMLDQRKRDWSDQILSTFQIDREILPEVIESHEVAGLLTAEAAEEMGLAKGAKVVAGGGDQPVGAVGNGVVRDGMTSATMGTSGVVFTHAKDYTVDPQSRVNTFCASVAGQYCVFGCVMAAGGSLQWYRNVLAEVEKDQADQQDVDVYELLTAQARKAPLGCEGLFFLPYLTGERTPHADPDARGCWIGLHARTTRNELVRSVMEGATFAMNDVVNCLAQRGLDIREIRLSGGGARSDFWRRMQADIYAIKCVTINAEEGPAYGAALLAATGAGEFATIAEACQAGIDITRTIEPDARAVQAYKPFYEQFRKLYPALKDQFANIAQL